MENMSRYLVTYLLNALWQTPLAATVAALACRAMRSSPAAHRHAVWAAALFVSVLLPIASIRVSHESAALHSAVPSPANAAAQQTPSASTGPFGIPDVTSGARAVSYAPPIGRLIASVYLLFLLLCAMRLYRNWRRTEKIRTEAGEATIGPSLQAVWSRCASSFAIRRPELLASSTLRSPVTAGFRRAVIILPEAIFSETSEDVLTTAIGHEMAHIVRRDFAWNVLYEVLLAPLCFHPAAMLIRRELGRTREMACDELVTRELLDPTVYARSILSIAEIVTALPRPGYTLGVFDGDILEERIRVLAERRALNRKNAGLLLTAGLSALALCALAASTLAISARAQAGPAEEQMRLAAEASRKGDSAQAARYLESAVRLDPGNIRPKLALAAALMKEANTLPGSDGIVSAARQQYLDALSLDSANRQAMEGMLSVSLFTKKYDESRQWVDKLIAQDPGNEAAYYTAGFVDWASMYPAYAQARSAAGMNMGDQGMIPDAAARQAFRNRFGSQLEDGFRMLQTALNLNPHDSDAMAYMNLLYRIQAGIADTSAASQQAVGQADEWVGKALAEKKRQQQNPSAPSRMDSQFAPPPPPPPPPPPANQPASAAPMPAHNRAETGGAFWQVVRGDTFADSLARSLKTQGFPVRFVASSDGQVRVMVGPYPDQASLDQAKAALTGSGVQVLREW